MRARSLATRGLALAMALGGLAVAPEARAQSSAPYRLEESFAQADFASTDPATGLTTEVVFAGIIQTTHSPGGPPTTTTSLGAVVAVYDASSHFYFLGSALVAADAVAVAPNLNSATVAGTLSVVSVLDGTTMTLLIDATFDGSGGVTRDRSNTQVNTPTSKYGVHSNGSLRDATFSGTITLDGMEITPDVVYQAEIVRDEQGTVSFLKP
jgi:hypothetical protein